MTDWQNKKTTADSVKQKNFELFENILRTCVLDFGFLIPAC